MKGWTSKQKLGFYSLALFTALIDQIVKIVVLSFFYEGQILPVIPKFFNLILTYNPGVAFGVFSGIDSDTNRYIVLAITTSIALTAVFIFACGEIGKCVRGKVALALIVGGAIGNMVDRIRIGKVVDYLDFYWGNYHYPAFNFADSCIFIAVVILLFTPSTSSQNS
jgi:signal peptidase II